MFIVGMSWPGKRVVGLNYILDFYCEKYRNNKIMWLNLLDYPSLLVYALSYEYLYRTWIIQQVAGMAMCAFSLLYCFCFMSESLYISYIKGDFDAVREEIKKIRRFNGMLHPINFNMDREVATR